MNTPQQAGPHTTSLVDAPEGDVGATLAFTPRSSSGEESSSGSHHSRTTVIIANRRAAAARAGLRFVLLEELGRGGMGVVLRGRDPDLHREVAIKLLRHSGDDRREARFIAEAQITGQLEHPNIIPVHEFGRDDEGRPWFAMKLINGRTMGDILTARAKDQAVEQDWPLSRLISVMIQVCHAVAFAHSRGVIHRDIKPANIMLGDFGEVLVVDWGLGKVVGDSSVESVRDHQPGGTMSETPGITLDGAIVGTPCYMPPEQARGELDRLGPHGDVYALGASLCEVLSGRPPITGSTVSEVVRKASAGEAVIPERDWRGYRVPRELAAILRRAMATRPEDRYPGCEALAADLQRYQEHRAVSVVDVTLVDAIGKFVRRHTLATAVGGIAAVALGVSLVGGYILKEGERLQALEARAVAENQRSRAEEALAQVEAQRRLTETGRRRERTLAVGSERQARRNERQRAVAIMAQADAALVRDRAPVARTLLEDIPREERDWSWRHLVARAAGSSATILATRPEEVVVTAGTGFALVGAEGRLRFISTAGQDRSGPTLARPVVSVASDEVGKTIVAGLATGGVVYLEGATGRVVANRVSREITRHVGIADGLVLGAQAQGLRWMSATDTGERSLPGVTALAVAPDRGWWVAAIPGSLVVRTADGSERRVAVTDPIEHLAVSRDGQHLAAVHGTRLRVWSMPMATVEADLIPGPELTAVVYGAQTALTLGTAEGSVLLWDQDLALPTLRLEVSLGPVSQLNWSADGRALAVRTGDQRLVILRD